MTLFFLANKKKPWQLLSSLNLSERLNAASHANGDSSANGGTGAASVNYEIVHHINGRIRLRILRLADDALFSERLAEALQKLPSVNSVQVRPRTRSLVVEYDKQLQKPGQNGSQKATSPTIIADLKQAIEAASGTETRLDLTKTAANKEAAAGPESSLELAKPPADKVEASGPKYYMQRLGLPVLGLGLTAGALAGLAVPPLLLGSTILVSALPIFKRSLQGIRDEHKLTVDFLDSTAIVLLTAQASFLAPATIVGVIEGSEVLRDWTARRSKQANLTLLMDHEKPIAVEQDGQIKHIAVDDLTMEDIILVYPGDQIPVDGLVLEGRAAVDQHQVTGDSIPVLYAEGDTVHASSLVIDGYLRLQPQRTGHETHVGQAIAALQAAPDTDTRVSNYARKVGNWAVIPTLAIAGLVGGTAGSLGRATGIISMDLGTGMRVSAPIAVLTAQTNAARQGIFIRSGQGLEALTQIDTIIFDKTATLTEGKARIVSVDIVNPRMRADVLLMLAASAEQALGHPIAESIVRYAHDQEVAIRPCSTWNYLAGLGVEAIIDEQEVHVGNLRYMAQLAIEVPQSGGPDTATRVYVAVNGRLAGIIACADPLRANAAAVIAQLQAEEIMPLLVSGDSTAVTTQVAGKVGIQADWVYAEMLPEQKLQVIQSLQAQGRKVAFVGDGVNDAAAMTCADVAITLGGATDLAREVADIVLTNDDLYDLFVAMEISRHAMRIIQQNKALVIVPNIGGIAYAALTVINPVTGVIINNGSAALAALNSLRPMAGPRKNVGQTVPIDMHTERLIIDEGDLV